MLIFQESILFSPMNWATNFTKKIARHSVWRATKGGIRG